MNALASVAGRGGRNGLPRWVGSAASPARTGLLGRLSVALVVVGCGLGVWTSSAMAASSPFFTSLGIGQMTVAREWAAAATLSGGQVLVAGGDNGNGSYLQSAEVYNPATGTFSAAGSMTVPRDEPAAAPLPDGQALIAGGENSNGYLQTAEVYDVATNTFSAVGQMGTPRVGAAAAPLPGGDVLIAGGANAGGPQPNAEIYDPTNGSFSSLGIGTMAIQRVGAVAAPLPNGQVLIAGGYDGSSYLSSAEIYDPVSKTFSPVAGLGMTTAREYAVAAPLPDGQVLIAGGENGNGQLSSAEIYDPTTQTFSPVSAPMTAVRTRAAAALLPDGQVLIASGLNSTGYLQSAEVYEPAAETQPAGGAFGDQTVGELSASQTIVVRNLGAQVLTISGTSLFGTNAKDFKITSDACSGRSLWFEQACDVTATFTPSFSGAESALITLTDNEPSLTTIVLSGTGVPTVYGPTGPQGPAGPAGRPGKVRLVKCRTIYKTITVNGHTKKVARERCTTKLVSGKVTFTTKLARARLTRAGVTYATGTSRHARLVLYSRRKLRAGSYTLILRRHRHHRWITRRERIVIA